MEKYGFIVLFVLILSVLAQEAHNPRKTKQYRQDYEYNRDTDAFYKLHTETRAASDTDAVCRVEGAELMSPTLPRDLVQLHAMFKKYPDLGNFVLVAHDGQSHESAEIQPDIDMKYAEESSWHLRDKDCLVVTREGAVESWPCEISLPFICKVQAEDAPYDRHCGVYATGYKYFASVGSCYKVPRMGYTWSEAYAECQAELAHLVVLNSEEERRVVQAFMHTQQYISGVTVPWYMFAGFRAEKPQNGTTRVFKTVLNETLEEAGFTEWSPTEPNNLLGREHCGSLFRDDGKLNDMWCSRKCAFICEKEVKNSY